MKKLILAAACVGALAACSPPAAEKAPEPAPPAPEAAAPATLHVMMAMTSAGAPGAPVGQIDIANSDAGAVFTLNLHGLPPGAHGFHIHANGSCDAMANDHGEMTAGGAAGGHWDPDNTGAHLGPEGPGHLGDLPALEVAADGSATQTLTAPRIHDISQLQGHALMIHANGDNYSDTPAPLGGGGPRLACGVIS